MKFRLFSHCQATDQGPGPEWLPDERARKIAAIDCDAAAREFASLLARRSFGRGARGTRVQRDGTPQGRRGAFYSSFIGNGRVGEQVRFLVVEE